MKEDIRNHQKEQQQQCGTLHKKRRDSKMTNTDTLTEEDIRALEEVVAEVAKKILKVLNTQ